MKTKRQVSLVVLALFLGLLSNLWVFAQAQAQQGRIDAFTYLIPYPTNQLDNQFDAAHLNNNLDNANIETTITIAVHRDDTIIYYDHWEKRGLEADLTSPTQITGIDRTVIWGDGDPSNNGGVTIPGGDRLSAGDIINLSNIVILPRDENQIFFDGGDVLTAIGGPIAVTLAVWPEGPWTNFGDNTPGVWFAGAWELYPTNRWGTGYVIPIGQNVDRWGATRTPLGGDPNPPVPFIDPSSSFTIVGLNVQAVQDGTTVSIDVDADNTPDINQTLDYGQQATVIQGVMAGATVQASAPVQVHVFTGDPNEPDGYYEARAYTMIPRSDWQKSYLAPRTSDGDYWIYNPHGAPLDVTVTTFGGGTTVINVPAGGAARYPNAVPPAGLSNVATGAYFTAPEEFYGVAALDESYAQDWGYALLPEQFLTSQVLVGLGVGDYTNFPDGPSTGANRQASQVYVTALKDTTISVRYVGGPPANIPVTRLQERAITDPNDFNMTGSYLSTTDGTPFVAVWGQDQTALEGSTSIDVGTGIVPLTAMALQKTFQLVNEADCTGSISQGDTLQFTLAYLNNATYQIDNAVVKDLLPAALTYVPNSIQVNGRAIPDAEGTSLFQAGGYALNAPDVPVTTGGTGVLTFEAIVNNAGTTITNQAEVASTYIHIPDSVTIVVPTGPFNSVLEVKKTLISPASGIAQSGEVVTFSLAITNTGGSFTVTKLPLKNSFDETYLTFNSASPPPNTQAAGEVSWDDLVVTFGRNLPPGDTFNLTTSFTVNEIANETSTTVRANVLGAVRDDNWPPLVCYNEAAVRLAPPPPPPPTPTPPPPTPPPPTPTPPPPDEPPPPPDGGDDDDDENPTPTPTPTPIPPTATAEATPVAMIPPTETPSGLPVSILPETGTITTSTGKADMSILLLLVLGGTSAVIFYRWLKH